MLRSKKLLVAGALSALALGGVAIGIAWATPGSGITTTIISGPVLMEETDIKTESDLNRVKIKIEGFSEVYVVHNKLVPGGHTGWHSHPGPSIISVKSGTATEYHSDEPGVPHVHAVGTTFVDDGEGAHIVVNEGTTDLELVAFQILPVGAPRRIDEPAP
ncbi:MAG TPA: hypothetical protein VFB96_25015 [Pirellulaceae bacterium]|nr:hypothetical protein [Pirellulaceae bacterium]